MAKDELVDDLDGGLKSINGNGPNGSGKRRDSIEMHRVGQVISDFAVGIQARLQVAVKFQDESRTEDD